MRYLLSPSPLFRTSTIQLIDCLLSKFRRCKILSMSTQEGTRQNMQTPLGSTVMKLKFLCHCNTAELADEARRGSAEDLVFQVNRQVQIN